MEQFAAKRREAVLNHPIKSAFAAKLGLQVGFARMFQTLNNHKDIEIRIFADQKSAFQWLGYQEPVSSDGE
jgi:hypothetical protein